MSSWADSRPSSDESPLCPSDHPGMTAYNGQERLSFLGRRLPSAFAIRIVIVDPGARRSFQEAEWRDALVVVERGTIQLEAAGGVRRDFVTGDVLCLMGLSLRALHNRGPEPAILVAVSRKP
jgi:quercetin dioxygenase-like cupin family protein